MVCRVSFAIGLLRPVERTDHSENALTSLPKSCENEAEITPEADRETFSG
jgi:hypothetical protein